MAGIVFTRDCSFRCRHCVMPGKKACEDRLSDLGRIDKAIGAMQEAGISDLVHTGRILKKEHLPILKKYQDKGLPISLIDNGSGQSLVRDIKAIGLRFDGIDVSIDGARQAHEIQRGKGTFDIAVSGAKALAAVGNRVSVIGTASSLNYQTIADDMQELPSILPFANSFNLATTSAVKHHETRLALTEPEMKILFAGLLKNSKKHPIRLSMYLNADLKAILPELNKYGRPEMKYISLEWKINNLTVAYFPSSIVPIEEYALDANGRHILPYGFDFNLDSRPADWEMDDDLIIKDPRESYRRLVDKYFTVKGRGDLEEEKGIFENYFKKK
jgi:MoaA/NifB/PqqE/SkfB family radical SAM enzyme